MICYCMGRLTVAVTAILKIRVVPSDVTSLLRIACSLVNCILKLNVNDLCRRPSPSDPESLHEHS